MAVVKTERQEQPETVGPYLSMRECDVAAGFAARGQ
jgi:hypothetical protein